VPRDNLLYNGGRCTLGIDGVCTGQADTVHHTLGRAVTGDDRRYIRPCAGLVICTSVSRSARRRDRAASRNGERSKLWSLTAADTRRPCSPRPRAAQRRNEMTNILDRMTAAVCERCGLTLPTGRRGRRAKYCSTGLAGTCRHGD
jgi:hypothetical protein